MWPTMMNNKKTMEWKVENGNYGVFIINLFSSQVVIYQLVSDPDAHGSL